MAGDRVRTAVRRADVGRREAFAGGLAGVLAWVVGYVASLRAAEPVFASSDPAVGAFVFYNAHLVPLSRIGGATRTGGNALLGTFGSLGYAAAVLPVVLLVLAGLVLGVRSGAPDRRGAARSGATVVLGYAPLSVVGAVVFTGSFFGGVYRPHPLYAVLLAGLVFPLACGSLGGAVGYGFGLKRRVVALLGRG